MATAQLGTQTSNLNVNSDLQNACYYLLAYLNCPRNEINQDIVNTYVSLYAFTKLQASALSAQIIRSAEEREAELFHSGFYWVAFTASAESHKTWRSCSDVLVKHIIAHRDRLSKDYPDRPLEAWLVGWALNNLSSPMRDLLRWSLSQKGRHEQDVTIEVFKAHLDSWSSLFDSEIVRLYVNSNLSKGKLFWMDQSKFKGPWNAHFIASSNAHLQWATDYWSKYCQPLFPSTKI